MMRTRDGMDRRLAALRAQPRDELVEEIAIRVSGPSSASSWPSLAYAASIAVMVIGTFASFGGLSYAASGSTRVVDAVAKVAASHKVVVKSSASNQYRHVAPKAPLKPPPAAVHPTHLGTLGAKTTGTLPFTGVSLLGTALLSFALMLTGFLIRRRERKRS
jgi:hypothetical protein